MTARPIQLAATAAHQLAEAVADAVYRAPATPTRPWRWREKRWLRVLSLLVWFGLTAGFLPGAIALYLDWGVVGAEAAILGLAQTLPLTVAWRRPLGALRIMAAGLLAGSVALVGVATVLPWPVPSWLAVCAVLFQVGAGYRRRVWAGAWLLVIAALAVAYATEPGLGVWLALSLAASAAAAVFFGDALNARYTAEASLAEQAELRRQDLARQAVLEERARIARELHDVVAHHMSVVALQSEAARFRIAGLPEEADRTFGIIRDASREALSETRRIVGLLREDDGGAERLPRPGLAGLDALLDRAREAGLRAESRITGVPRELDDGVDLSAYRIVQEALSNASRYAPGAAARVEVRYGKRALTVRVEDDGPAPGAVPDAAGGGHGLVGMRERVAMLGGTFRAGPRDRGFAVAVELPYEGAAPP